MNAMKRWNRPWLVAVFLLTACLFAPATPAADERHEILVLGGTGQLGACIVRLLVDDGHDVLTLQCLDRADCAGKIYHAADPSLVGKERPAEYVVRVVGYQPSTCRMSSSGRRLAGLNSVPMV